MHKFSHNFQTAKFGSIGAGQSRLGNRVFNRCSKIVPKTTNFQIMQVKLTEPQLND